MDLVSGELEEQGLIRTEELDTRVIGAPDYTLSDPCDFRIYARWTPRDSRSGGFTLVEMVIAINDRERWLNRQRRWPSFGEPTARTSRDPNLVASTYRGATFGVEGRHAEGTGGELLAPYAPAPAAASDGGVPAGENEREQQ